MSHYWWQEWSFILSPFSVCSYREHLSRTTCSIRTRAHNRSTPRISESDFGQRRAHTHTSNNAECLVMIFAIAQIVQSWKKENWRNETFILLNFYGKQMGITNLKQILRIWNRNFVASMYNLHIVYFNYYYFFKSFGDEIFNLWYTYTIFSSIFSSHCQIFNI